MKVKNVEFNQKRHSTLELDTGESKRFFFTFSFHLPPVRITYQRIGSPFGCYQSKYLVWENFSGDRRLRSLTQDIRKYQKYLVAKN